MKQCFIISLPRAGSTLLQRLLAQHPQIATRSEPWMVLPFVYALRREGARAEYNHRLMVTGFEHFLDSLPEKELNYYREAGEMISRLQRQVAGGDAEYFLDKTPRYYLILDELKKMFPRAKFIVLHRNPLAVVASIVNTWNDGRFRFRGTAMDIYEGPQRIAAFLKTSPHNVLEVRYEQLVTDARAQMDRITQFLELDALSSISLPDDAYFKTQPLGDPTGVHRFQNVSSTPVEQWKSAFASPIRRRWARRYLEFLGDAALQRMGHDREQLLKESQALPISWKQTATDIIDLNRRLFVLMLCRSLSFQRDLKRNKYNPQYKWVRGAAQPLPA